MRAGDVVGRERELAAAESFLEALSGGPRLLELVGEAGIGKTTIWHEVIDRAAARDFGVLTCMPTEPEIALSFAGLADLLSDVEIDSLAVLPGPQRRALNAVLLRVDPEGPALDQRAVFAAVVSTLSLLARMKPVVVAIDDANWLDVSSRYALQFALRRLPHLPIGLIMSMRSDRGATGSNLQAIFSDRQRQRLDVGPLSLGALAELLRRRTGLSLSRTLLRQIGVASWGNPFFALEIAQSLKGAGYLQPGQTLILPASLQELVAGRILKLSPATREALFAASELAAPTVGLVAGAVPKGAAALSQAEGAGIIKIADGQIRFTHPLLGSAMGGAVKPIRRRDLHRVLAGRVSDPEERARHLALAASGPDAQVASELERAAKRARSRGAPETAAALLEQSISLTPESRVADRRRRMVAAADDHFYAGDWSRPRTLLETVLRELPASCLRAEALHLLAEVLSFDDNTAGAVELLEEAATCCDGNPRLQARIHLDLAFALYQIGHVPGALPHLEAARSLAEAFNEPGLLAQALATKVLVDFMLGLGIDTLALHRALDVEDWDERAPAVFRPSYCVGFIAGITCDFDNACTWLARVRAQLAERGQESELPLICLMATYFEAMRGDLSAASRIAEEAMAASLTQEGRVPRAAALSARSYVAACRGDTDVARTAAAAALELFRESGWDYGPVWPTATLGFVALSLGDPLGAERAFRPLAEMVAAIGIGEPLSAFFLPDAIEALIAVGETDRAEALTVQLERRGRELDRPWALATGGRSRALVCAARGDVSGAADALEAALQEHQRLAMPFELGRTLLVLGQVRRRRREKAKAREALQRAEEIFETYGAPLWADRARDEISRIGVRRAGADLSETERRVASLVASGLTNKAVASRLSISPKTVELNLTKIYRKLNVRSRAELGEWRARLNDTSKPAARKPNM